MLKVFTVHDSKAEAYLPPIYFKTKGEALRAFETTVKNPESQFNQYPADYTLYELGDFEETTGDISTHDKPQHLANAAEYIQ